MAKPLVTIVVPIYNGDRYLRTTLQSILSQDLDDFEVLCIDDGSTDSSRDIVRQLAAGDSRIRLICQANGGASAARNAGIEAACGDFVAFLDADDWYGDRAYLRTLYEGACRNGQLVSAACFANYRGPDDIETDFSQSEHYEGYSFSADGVVAYRDYQFDYGFHRFLFSQSLFEDGRNHFGDLTFFEDPVFLTRILDEAGTFYATKRASYLYRCEYKPRRWKTANLVDLLEGVRLNLEFSKERGYGKLHWYTAHHLDSESGDVGIGVNRNLDLRVVDEKLRQVEECLDHGLLALQAREDAQFVPCLRKDFEEAASRGFLRTVRGTLGYWRRHR